MSCPPHPLTALTHTQCPVSLHGYVISRAGFDAVLDATVPLRSALGDQLRNSPNLIVACAKPALVTENGLRSDR
jgi:hypothetical protein